MTESYFYGEQPGNDGVFLIYYQDEKPVAKRRTNAVTWYIIVGLAKDYFEYRWAHGKNKQEFLEQWKECYNDNEFTGMADWLSSIRIFPQSQNFFEKFKNVPDWCEGGEIHAPFEFNHSDLWHEHSQFVAHFNILEMDRELTEDEVKSRKEHSSFCARSDFDYLDL